MTQRQQTETTRWIILDAISLRMGLQMYPPPPIQSVRTDSGATKTPLLNRYAVGGRGVLFRVKAVEA